MKKILLFWLVLLAVSASALDVKEYSASFNVIDSSAVVEIELSFDNETGAFEFGLPEDYTALSVYVDDKKFDSELADNILRIGLNKTSTVKFSYVTSEFIDKTNFLMNMKLDFDVDNLMIRLVLPEGATLKKPMKKADLASGSIYPQPTDSTTDGKSLVFVWEKEDIRQGDELSIFAQIQPRERNSGLIIALAAFGFIIIILFIYILKKKPRIIIKKEDMVEKHLKEDEEQIINVLKTKEGSCEQGTLRVVTGFSKATLSRLLSELEARKVIFKEKRGKKNLVFLKK